MGRTGSTACCSEPRYFPRWPGARRWSGSSAEARRLNVGQRNRLHDFNNLLGAVLALAESAAAELVVGSHPGEELEGIKEVAIRGSEIVRQLMIYAGKESDVPERGDISATIEADVRYPRQIFVRGIGDRSWQGPAGSQSSHLTTLPGCDELGRQCFRRDERQQRRDSRHNASRHGMLRPSPAWRRGKIWFPAITFNWSSRIPQWYVVEIQPESLTRSTVPSRPAVVSTSRNLAESSEFAAQSAWRARPAKATLKFCPEWRRGRTPLAGASRLRSKTFQRSPESRSIAEDEAAICSVVKKMLVRAGFRRSKPPKAVRQSNSPFQGRKY